MDLVPRAIAGWAVMSCTHTAAVSPGAHLECNQHRVILFSSFDPPPSPADLFSKKHEATHSLNIPSAIPPDTSSRIKADDREGAAVIRCVNTARGRQAICTARQYWQIEHDTGESEGGGSGGRKVKGYEG